MALVFFAFNPTLIAHSHLVTVDVGAATLVLLTLYLFYRWALAPSPARLLFAGLALGLAQLAKTTAVLLYPILFLLVLVLLARRGEASGGAGAARRPCSGRWRRWRRWWC